MTSTWVFLAAKFALSLVACLLLGGAYVVSEHVMPTIVLRTTIAPYPGKAREFHLGCLAGLRIADSEYPFIPVQPRDPRLNYMYDTTRRLVKGHVLPVGAPHRPGGHRGFGAGHWHAFETAAQWVVRRRVSAARQAAVRARLESLRPTEPELADVLRAPSDAARETWRRLRWERWKDLTSRIGSRSRLTIGQGVDLYSGAIGHTLGGVPGRSAWVSDVQSMALHSASEIPDFDDENTLVFFESEQELLAFFDSDSKRWRVLHVPSTTLLFDTHPDE